MATTQRDIAREAGVSQAVVSDVLQGHVRLRVTPETRSRVLAAAGRLGYRPNALARGLRARRAGQIAYLFAEGRPTSGEPILAGAMSSLADAGTRLLLSTAPTEPDLAGLAEELLATRACDGVIVRAYGDPLRLWERLAPLGDRLVVVGQCSDARLNSVAHDVPAMLRQALHLLTGRGRERPALLGRPRASSYDRQVWDHWLRLCEEAGIPASSAIAEDRLEGRREVRSLLARSPSADGFVVVSEQAAVGACDALRALGLGAGRDLDLVVIGPSTAGWALDSGTHLMGTDGAAVGRRAVELLLENLAVPGAPPRRIRLVPEVITL